MRWNAQARAVTVCFGLVGLFSVYSIRLIDLQIVKHEEYAALAAERNTFTNKLSLPDVESSGILTGRLSRRTSRSKRSSRTRRIYGTRWLWLRQSQISWKWIRGNSRTN